MGTDASTPVQVLRPSFCSLLLTPEANGHALGTATGFVVVRHEVPYLISNWHVFAGKNPLTHEVAHNSGAVPDTVLVKLAVVKDQGIEFVEHREQVSRDYEPLWLQHPVHGRAVDVAALRLTGLDSLDLARHDPWFPTYVQTGICDDVNIVGFPFGANTNGLAIWTRGYIASEYDFDYNDLPCFLVDSRTRPGQSGSPVVFFRVGAYIARYGALVMPGVKGAALPTPGQPLSRDNPPPMPPCTEQFLGVYSGRINAESDLGYVWRPSAVQEVIDGQKVAIRF